MRVYYLLKQIREEKNISLRELERKTGISKAHLNYIEKQEREQTFSILLRIAKALDVPLEELYRVEW